jgi:hypothetical protein
MDSIYKTELPKTRHFQLAIDGKICNLRKGYRLKWAVAASRLKYWYVNSRTALLVADKKHTLGRQYHIQENLIN